MQKKDWRSLALHFDVGRLDTGVDDRTAVARRCGTHLAIDPNRVGDQGKSRNDDGQGQDEPRSAPVRRRANVAIWSVHDHIEFRIVPNDKVELPVSRDENGPGGTRNVRMQLRETFVK
jgi:hypothetical protein